LSRILVRWLGPWLLGLFVVAQAVGVLPLMLDHTLHAYESQTVDNHDHSAPGRHGDHRHGAADVKDECCWLNHLTGVATFSLRAAPTSFVATKLIFQSPKVLVANAPNRLDRPPKTSSPI
jgi:hypothetical protein